VGVDHVLPPGRLAHEDIAGRGVGDDGGDDAGAADGDDDWSTALVVEKVEVRGENTYVARGVLRTTDRQTSRPR